MTELIKNEKICKNQYFDCRKCKKPVQALKIFEHDCYKEEVEKMLQRTKIGKFQKVGPMIFGCLNIRLPVINYKFPDLDNDSPKNFESKLDRQKDWKKVAVNKKFKKIN